MIKYYILPVNNGDTYKCIDLFKKNQGKDDKFIYLGNNDISQIFRIPFMQNYEGIAVVLTTKVLIKKSFAVENLLNDNDFIHDKDLNFFIINCASEYFKNNFNPSKLVSVDLRFYINSLKNTDENINTYIDILNTNKSNVEFIGDLDKPIKLVFNGSTWELSK